MSTPQAFALATFNGSSALNVLSIQPSLTLNSELSQTPSHHTGSIDETKRFKEAELHPNVSQPDGDDLMLVHPS